MSSAGPARSIALPARAKLNLDLQVVCGRPDGMHELRTHMVAVELHDLLVATAAEDTALTTGGIELQTPATNSVLRAHEVVEAAAGRKLPTRYWLHKRIPPGSGLGGASSDAAAAMRALQYLYGLKLDLKTIAAGVGADVPFFLTGGTALVEGVGDRVARLDEQGQAWFVIAWPGIELSTAEVYKAWDGLAAEERRGPNELRAAAARVDGGIERFAAQLGDGWQMTGSGSAFFLRSADRGGAEAAAGKLNCWTAVTCSVGTWGE